MTEKMPGQRVAVVTVLIDPQCHICKSPDVRCMIVSQLGLLGYCEDHCLDASRVLQMRRMTDMNVTQSHLSVVPLDEYLADKDSGNQS